MLSLFSAAVAYSVPMGGKLRQKDLKRLRGDYIARPGEDEYDVIYRTGDWTIGLFIFWTAVHRGLRWLWRRIVTAPRWLRDLYQPPKTRLAAVEWTGPGAHRLQLPPRGPSDRKRPDEER